MPWQVEFWGSRNDDPHPWAAVNRATNEPHDWKDAKPFATAEDARAYIDGLKVSRQRLRPAEAA